MNCHMIPISGEKRMRIRAVEEKDLPELARIDAEAFPSAPYPYFVLRQYFDICGDHLFVVEDDEPRLYGYVLASPPHHTLSWIISLGVTPELRRNGLGQPADGGDASPITVRGRAADPTDGRARQRLGHSAVQIPRVRRVRNPRPRLLRPGRAPPPHDAVAANRAASAWNASFGSQCQSERGSSGRSLIALVMP